MKRSFMRIRIVAIIAVALAARTASAAPDIVEMHQRVQENIFKGIKTVRDVLVPRPAIDFVESFPPIAIPRAHILQLAQAGPPVQIAPGAVQIAQAPPADGSPVDP